MVDSIQHLQQQLQQLQTMTSKLDGIRNLGSIRPTWCLARWRFRLQLELRVVPPLKVPPLDMDAFIAKVEGRVRSQEAGEQVAPSRLAVNMDSMPAVTNTSTPIAEEVSAMADWLFSNVQWTTEGVERDAQRKAAETPVHDELEIAR